jgi:hypothetical protein
MLSALLCIVLRLSSVLLVTRKLRMKYIFLMIIIITLDCMILRLLKLIIVKSNFVEYTLLYALRCSKVVIRCFTILTISGASS